MMVLQQDDVHLQTPDDNAPGTTLLHTSQPSGSPTHSSLATESEETAIVPCMQERSVSTLHNSSKRPRDEVVVDTSTSSAQRHSVPNNSAEIMTRKIKQEIEDGVFGDSLDDGIDNQDLQIGNNGCCDELSQHKSKGGPIIVTANGGYVDFPLVPLHARLICQLCHGYYRDPYTITECLHTFCKSCLLVEFFVKGHRRCPKCDISLEPDPMKEVLSDYTLMEVVDKIFPELKEWDEREERNFYRTRNIKLKKENCSMVDQQTTTTTRDSNKDIENVLVGNENDIDHSVPRGDCNHEHGINKKDEIDKQGKLSKKEDSATVSSGSSLPVEDQKPMAIPPDELNFNLIPDESVQRVHQMPSLTYPILRTSGRLKVAQIKKYLLKKLQIKAIPASLEILCNGDPLGDELSLTFIQRTRWLHPVEDLTLNYRFAEESVY